MPAQIRVVEENGKHVVKIGGTIKAVFDTAAAAWRYVDNRERRKLWASSNSGRGIYWKEDE